MNRRIHMALLCLLLSLSAFSQNFKIDIQISDEDTIMMLLLGETIHDTVYTGNGSFDYSGVLSSAEMLRVILVKNSQSIEAAKSGNERGIRSKDDVYFQDFFTEGGLLHARSSFKELNQTKFLLEKPFTNEKYKEFRERFDPLVKTARVIIDSSYTFDTSAAAKKVFPMLLDRVVDIEKQVAKRFAIQNTDNAAGAYVLYRFAHIDNARTLDSVYTLFDSSLHQNIYLMKVKEKIKNLYGLKQDMPAPEFNAVSNLNENISLKKFKGKLIVLDFWGSWCPPCIKGFPEMQKYYTKYKGRVEFIGIACNDTDKDWRKAIQQYKLSWPQILNGQDVNDLSKIYNIEAYPTKVIIDEAGNYLYSFVGEEHSFYEQLDLLMKQK